jgi:hypothetical protein
MKALSLWQPWASLWCSDAKEHETRHWQLHHRGWLLVHAAKRPIDADTDYALEIICKGEFGDEWRKALPLGMIIGAVNIVDVRSTTAILKDWGVPPGPINTRHWIDYQCGNYDAGRFGFLRREFKRFAQPIPYRGQQGPFDVPDEIVQPLFNRVRAIA